MRKKLLFGLIIFLIVLLLLFAFANIGSTAPIYISSIYPKNMNLTFVILLSGIMGFLIGFVAMLHSFEVRKEHDLQEYSEASEVAPAAVTPEEVVKEAPPEPVENADSATTSEPDDHFDADDEILG